MQGGYDGTHFLANVEVYDPVKDLWEDGIPLTSGRSGLASAVIYQPSCPQNYSQDCIANISSNREYDDESKPPDNNDDDADISSPGSGTSYHLNCSSNFFNGGSGGHDVHDLDELADCRKIKGNSCELLNIITGIRAKFRVRCSQQRETNITKRHQDCNNVNVTKLAKFHLKCNDHSQSCPLQKLQRRFRHFLSNHKHKNAAEKLYKSKGN